MQCPPSSMSIIPLGVPWQSDGLATWPRIKIARSICLRISLRNDYQTVGKSPLRSSSDVKHLTSHSHLVKNSSIITVSRDREEDGGEPAPVRKSAVRWLFYMLWNSDLFVCIIMLLKQSIFYHKCAAEFCFWCNKN